MFNEGGKMTATKYELPTDTITAAIRTIPPEKWEAFCKDLHKYMVYHSEYMQKLEELADLGIITFQEPKVFTWVDDDTDNVTVRMIVGASE